MRILVTGVAGFGGRHLLRHLVERGGREIHGADHAPLEGIPEPEPLRSGLASYRALDVTDTAAVRDWVRELRPDQVVHMAAQASGAQSIERPAETYRVNALGPLNLLEALRVTAPGARILLIGSADIYGSGPAGEKIREDAPIRPRNPYSVSKAAEDQLGELYALTYRLPVIRTRTFTHTGPGQRPSFALAGFADQLARIHERLAPPEIRVGNLDVVREYGDVRDVVRAYDLLLERGEPGEAYNVATGQGHRLRDLLDRLIEVSGVRAAVAVDPSRVRARDTDHLVGDFTKLHAATGWTPVLPMERTLADLYASALDRVRAETRTT